MKIAFYAPMNVPDDGQPSGDRLIARQIMEGLKDLGHDVFLVSRLKTWAPEPTALPGFRKEAEAEIERLKAQKFDAWFTYHVYYKAPDLLGPEIAAAQGIPYFIAEASLSPRRANDQWAEGYKLARDAIHQAQAIFSTCPRDLPALEAEGLKTVTELRPWIDPEAWEAPHLPPHTGLRLHTTAMMREGDKLDSYRTLARALRHLTVPWSLTVAGDGPAHERVVGLFAEFGMRINFAGPMNHEHLIRSYGAADVFVWPGHGEGLGVVYLEAQAAGLPVVAIDNPALRGILTPETACLTGPEPEDMAAAIDGLADETVRKAMAERGRAHVEANFSKAQFLRTLNDTIGGAF